MSLKTTGGSHDYEIIFPDGFAGDPNTSVAPSDHSDDPRPPAPTILPVTQVPAGVPQWLIASVTPQYTDSFSPFYRTFLKSKPKALGIFLIVAAILEVALGIALIFTASFYSLYSMVSFWGSVFYIIAGSLTIAAQSRPSVCLVKGSLAFTIINVIVSVCALIFDFTDMAVIRRCYSCRRQSAQSDYYMSTCHVPLYVLSSLLLVINVLVFCISLSISIFGCRSLSHVQSNITQVFVIQNNGTPSMDISSAEATTQFTDGYSNVV